ncbi:MAG TPA: DUF3106 domain-containing protein [Granulicella sp.]
MALFSPTRFGFTRTLQIVIAASCLCVPTGLFAAQPRPGFGQQRQAPPPSARVPRPQQQEHFSQWMDRHRNMSPRDQQNALEREPGFHQLPSETQQRMRDRLTQLNNMPPQQRERLLDRTEAMERLTPEQRQQWRNSVQQLGNYPPDRRRMVAQAFRSLREMPPQQRQMELNSPRFRSQFSDQERGTLSNLLSVEPYHAGGMAPGPVPPPGSMPPPPPGR